MRQATRNLRAYLILRKHEPLIIQGIRVSGVLLSSNVFDGADTEELAYISRLFVYEQTQGYYSHLMGLTDKEHEAFALDEVITCLN